MKNVRCYDYVDMAKVINNNTMAFDQRFERMSANQIRMNGSINTLQAKCNSLSILSGALAVAFIFEWLENKKTKARLLKLEQKVGEMESRDEMEKLARRAKEEDDFLK